LVVVELWSFLIQHEPPGGSTDRRTAHVTADRHVAEEQPPGDERFFRVAWRFVHDVEIWWVEAERRGWQAVRHQVDPEQLNRDESFRHSQGGSQEYADHLRRTVSARASITGLA